MSDHLPECIYVPRNVDPKKGIEWGGQPCICYALRACEQRVLDAAWGAVATIAWPTGTEHFPTDYDYAWNDGVIESLAAIDALRGA